MSTPDSSINYVYDCGALDFKVNQAALTREIGEYASRTDRVHLVFLSHFDFDHVSGVPTLAGQLEIDEFIIPMIPPKYRLLSLARQISNGTFNSDDPTASEFYLAFIIDPRQTLADLGQNIAVRVVEPTIEILNGNGPAAPPELISPRELPNANTGPLSLVTTRDGIVVDCGGEVVWEWRHLISGEAKQAVGQFVAALVSSGAISRTENLDDIAVIKDLVLKKSSLLADVYKIAIKKVKKSFTRNATSLMLYSGPPLAATFRAYRSSAAKFERTEVGAWKPRPGWLGLGDADLRAAKRIKFVNDGFRERKPSVGTFAPSHHGSHLDWSAQLLDDFCSGNDHAPTIVFGASGAYGHPRHEVLMELNELGCNTIVVGLEEKSRWTESLVVFVQP
ncbi:hypothetical protein [Arthrobacter sp. 2RAF6]|uniref:hypothetical protein n=1 Tax=Arthrobacter sp. 2RAF6 TaxID=3233002 RepID=UPI003F93C1EC